MAIITSQRHVWDGVDQLFDFNYQALGVDPNERFTPLSIRNCRQENIGKFIPLNTAPENRVGIWRI